MKRILYYVIRYFAFFSRLFSSRLYMNCMLISLSLIGVKIEGRPEYIDYSADIDASGGVWLGEQVVISKHVIILSHDWAFLRGLRAVDGVGNVSFDDFLYKRVFIGKQTFIGAGAIILPGTTIGNFCIIGAGAVVKGDIPDYSVVIGNPSKIICDTRRYGEKFIQTNATFHC
ncbi:MAG: acyltransferase [Bacteroidaceae bacterium]|nr:acyltransferase [Bacteroidaceae bacterium]